MTMTTLTLVDFCYSFVVVVVCLILNTFFSLFQGRTSHWITQCSEEYIHQSLSISETLTQAEAVKLVG